MLKQLILATLAAKDLDTIKQDLEEIRKLLPFLITLTPAERHKLFKAGNKSLAFMQDAVLTVQNNPAIIPASFDSDGFEKAVNLFAVLNELCTLICQLSSDLADTKLAVGSDAIRSSTEVYTYVKAASAKVPGLKTIEEKLRPRFAKARRQKSDSKSESKGKAA